MLEKIWIHKFETIQEFTKHYKHTSLLLLDFIMVHLQLQTH